MNTPNDLSRISCSKPELVHFTRQLSVLVQAGVPIHEACEFMSAGGDADIYRVVSSGLAKHLYHGRTLSLALSNFPRVFPRSYIVLVQAAEQTGRLAKALMRASTLLERQLKLRRHIQKSLSYPVLVAGVSMFLTLILFNTVIPSILETVTSLGGDLPLPTVILVGIVGLVRHPLAWLVGVALVIAGLAYFQNPTHRRRVLVLLTRFPLVGRILLLSANVQYCQNLSTLLSSGVDTLKACRVAANTTGHPLLEDDGPRVSQAVRNGERLSEAWEGSKLYPNLLQEMAAVGEEVGALPLLLDRAGEIFENEVESRMDVFAQVIEPLMLASIAVGVGFILVAILLPLLAITATL